MVQLTVRTLPYVSPVSTNVELESKSGGHECMLNLVLSKTSNDALGMKPYTQSTDRQTVCKAVLETRQRSETLSFAATQGCAREFTWSPRGGR